MPTEWCRSCDSAKDSYYHRNVCIAGVLEQRAESAEARVAELEAALRKIREKTSDNWAAAVAEHVFKPMFAELSDSVSTPPEQISQGVSPSPMADPPSTANGRAPCGRQPLSGDEGAKEQQEIPSKEDCREGPSVEALGQRQDRRHAGRDGGERPALSDREILEALTQGLPRRPATPREREIFDEHKRKLAAGMKTVTTEERDAQRSSEPVLKLCTGCRDHTGPRGPVLPSNAKPALEFRARIVVDGGPTFSIPVLLTEGEVRYGMSGVIAARDGVRATLSFEAVPAVTAHAGSRCTEKRSGG